MILKNIFLKIKGWCCVMKTKIKNQSVMILFLCLIFVFSMTLFGNYLSIQANDNDKILTASFINHSYLSTQCKFEFYDANNKLIDSFETESPFETETRGKNKLYDFPIPEDATTAKAIVRFWIPFYLSYTHEYNITKDINISIESSADSFHFSNHIIW